MKIKGIFFILQLILINPAGVMGQYWMQSGGSATIDEGLSVCVDNNNNVYNTGYFTSTFEMSGQQLNSQGLDDIYICKLDSTGALDWLIREGGSAQERALSIDADGSGNIVISGYFYGTTSIGGTQLISNGQQDIFIAKYSSSGTFLWVRQAGGINNEQGNDVHFDNAGNIVVTGEFSGTCNFSATTLTSQLGSIDIFLAKYDSNGNLIFAKKGSGKFSDRGTSIAIDLQNNIYLSGMFSDTITFSSSYPNTIMNAAFLLKMNSSGNEQWFRWLGSGTNLNHGGINFDSGGINFTGSFSGSLNFFGSGGTTTINPPTPFNIYIGRTDLSGNLMFLTSEGSSSQIQSTCIDSKSNGDIIIGGNFKCKFNDYSAIYGSGIFCSVGYEDNFIASYSNSGNRQWARQFGGRKSDFVRDLAIRKDSIPVFTGSYFDNYLIPVKFNQFQPYGIVYDDYTNYSSSTIYCTDNFYGNYVIYQSKGNGDAFVNSGINLQRQPLDVFTRTPGVCNRNFNSMFITDILGNPDDTLLTCAAGVLTFQAGGLAYDNFLAPELIYSWNTGAVSPFIQVAITGNYNAVVTTSDGCFTHSDNTYLIASFQPAPLIADNKGINSGSSAPNDIVLCAPDSVELSCINQGSSTISWTGLPVGVPTLSVNVSGYYTCTLTNPLGCAQSSVVKVEIANPLANTILPKIKWADDSDNNDSIVVCQNVPFKATVYDELSNPGGMLTQCIPEMTIAFFNIDPSATGFTDESFITCTDLFDSFYAQDTGNFNLIVTVQVIRNNPCGSDTMYVTDTLNVLVNPAITGPLAFSVTAPENFCPGYPATLVASPTQNSYTWIFDSNGSINIGSGATYQTFLEGIYTVNGIFMSINPFGCLDSMFGTFTDTISYYDQPTINLLPSSGLVCPNDSVQLSCQGSSNIDWFGPTGAISSGTNIIYSNLPGYYYCLQTVDTGCTLFSNTAELMQYSSPTLIALPQSVCVNDSTTISVISSPGSNLNWLPPLSGTGTSQVVSVAGTYYCDVISCGDTSNLSITINNLPTPPAPQITITPPDLISSVANNYQWLLNGIPIALANQQIYTPNQPGTYTVMITDSNGCTAISDPVLITSVFEYQTKLSISVHPNPVNSYLQIISSDTNINLLKANYTFYNLQGQKIKLSQPDFKNRIDVRHIPNGVYFLEINLENKISTLKVVILNEK